MDIQITRHYLPTHTSGALYLDGKLECFTLEWPKEGAKYACIPEGVYPVVLYDSPHFHRTVLLLQAVPGRTEIEIHMGNTKEDSKGCIIVGQTRNVDGSVLGNSVKALDSLIGKVTSTPLTLTISS